MANLKLGLMKELTPYECEFNMNKSQIKRFAILRQVGMVLTYYLQTDSEQFYPLLSLMQARTAEVAQLKIFLIENECYNL